MDAVASGSKNEQKFNCPDDVQTNSATLSKPDSIAVRHNEEGNIDPDNPSSVAVELASSSSSGIAKYTNVQGLAHNSTLSGCSGQGDRIKADCETEEKHQSELNPLPEVVFCQAKEQNKSHAQRQVVMERLSESEETESPPELEIEEFSAEEESELRRKFRRVTVLGGDRSINMQLIEPYRDVVRHGGYIDAKCAVVTLSLDHLPPRTLQDYDVMLENVFLYVLSTLEQLIVESFILVIVSTYASSESTSHGQSHVDLPALGWLRSHHTLVDRRLRKSLRLAVVLNASMRFRTLMMVANFIVSSKLKKKLRYVRTAKELERYVPLANVYLPDEFKVKPDDEETKHRSSNSDQVPQETRNEDTPGPSPSVRRPGQQKNDRRTTVLF